MQILLMVWLWVVGFVFFFFFFFPALSSAYSISAGAGPPDSLVSQLTGEVTRAKQCDKYPCLHLGPARHLFCLLLTILLVEWSHQHPGDCFNCNAPVDLTLFVRSSNLRSMRQLSGHSERLGLSQTCQY